MSCFRMGIISGLSARLSVITSQGFFFMSNSCYLFNLGIDDQLVVSGAYGALIILIP